MADLEDRVARLEQPQVDLLEVVQILGKRIDALEAQLDRNEPAWEVSESAAQRLGVKAGRYVLVSR
jgi:hypothetical protein